ncbi:hypothetical protein Pelo_5524 [Pelomyxa schiedti]|nr:hypothetical protein Pelo_5524 [Pelomyxa schiedti]
MREAAEQVALPQGSSDPLDMLLVDTSTLPLPPWASEACTGGHHAATCPLAAPPLGAVLSSLVAANRALADSLRAVEQARRRSEAQLRAEIQALRNQVGPCCWAPAPGGIATNVPVSAALRGGGWNVHYREAYCHATQPENIDPGRGEWLLVASQQVGSEELALVAVGRRTKVCRRTESRTEAVKHRGTYWYFVEGLCFGFSPTAAVNLAHSDVSYVDAEHRLSWYLGGNGRGGWRSGSTTDLWNSQGWLKLICWS